MLFILNSSPSTQQQSSYCTECKEFQQEQRHQRAFLDKIENSSASGSGKVMEKIHLSVYLNQLWRADFSRILSGNSKWFLASWETYSFSDIQSRASYNPARGKHPFNPIYTSSLKGGGCKTCFFVKIYTIQWDLQFGAWTFIWDWTKRVCWNKNKHRHRRNVTSHHFFRLFSLLKTIFTSYDYFHFFWLFSLLSTIITSFNYFHFYQLF